MRRLILAALCSMAILGLVGMGSVGADPKPGSNPSGNFFYYYLTCDQGYGELTIATSNFGAAGQIVDGSGVLVARQVTIQEVDVATGEVLRGPTTFVFGQGQKTPHPNNLVTCTGSTDPYVNEFEQTVVTEATYLMLATPRR